MNFVFFCFIFTLLNSAGTICAATSDAIILIDVSPNYKSLAVRTLGVLLGNISLRQHRVSLHTTDGLSQTPGDFHSKECLVQKFKTYNGGRKVELVHLFKRRKNMKLAASRFTVLLLERALSAREKRIFQENFSGDSLTFYMDDMDFEELERFVQRYKRYFKGNLAACCSSNNISHIDECGRKCECVSNTLVNCRRVRKDFSAMTFNERRRYAKAVKSLSTHQIYVDMFSEYAAYHKNYFKKGIHENDEFHPWHRKYILGFENMLRQIDCRVTIPVWNWALFSENAWSPNPSYHIWDTEGGLGGNGHQSTGWCVQDGIFARGYWSAPAYENHTDVAWETCKERKQCFNITQKIGNRDCLRRRFLYNTIVPSIESVLEVIRHGDVDNLNAKSAKWHRIIHEGEGGHMTTSHSSNTPEFWMHHAMLDAVWEAWQKRTRYEHAGRFASKATLLGFLPSEYKSDYVFNSNLAGCGVHVEYANIFV